MCHLSADPSAAEGLAFLKALEASAGVAQIGLEVGGYASLPSALGGLGVGILNTADDLAGGGLRLAGQASKELAQEGYGAAPKRFSRYMSEAELKVVRETGKLRGGNPGKTYFTTNRYRTKRSAQRYLSLPTMPDVRVDFEILNTPQIFGPKRVDPAFGQPGGGVEYWSEEEVIVRILREVWLR